MIRLLLVLIITLTVSCNSAQNTISVLEMSRVDYANTITAEELKTHLYIIAGDAMVSGGMAYVSLSYESVVEIAGIQFTISDEPDVATAVAFDADDDVFMQVRMMLTGM